MNTDDRRAGYLADSSTEKPPDSSKLDSVRGILSDDTTWGRPPEGAADELLATIRAELVGRGGRRVWPAWIAGAVGIALLIIMLSSLFTGGTEVTLVGTELQPSANGVALVGPTGAGWEIRLDLEDLPSAEPGYYYEGWVWNDEGEGVSIGTFHLRPENVPVTLWSGVDLADYPSIWISLQEVGGGAELSGSVVMRGRLEADEG